VHSRRLSSVMVQDLKLAAAAIARMTAGSTSGFLDCSRTEEVLSSDQEMGGVVRVHLNSEKLDVLPPPYPPRPEVLPYPPKTTTGECRDGGEGRRLLGGAGENCTFDAGAPHPPPRSCVVAACGSLEPVMVVPRGAPRTKIDGWGGDGDTRMVDMGLGRCRGVGGAGTADTPKVAPSNRPHSSIVPPLRPARRERR
jgi:hypothetical protein